MPQLKCEKKSSHVKTLIISFEIICLEKKHPNICTMVHFNGTREMTRFRSGRTNFYSE